MSIFNVSKRNNVITSEVNKKLPNKNRLKYSFLQYVKNTGNWKIYASDQIKVSQPIHDKPKILRNAIVENKIE